MKVAWLWGLSLVVFASAASKDASARASARLDYRPGAGAAQCPDEAALREGVAIRLGYDPFRPDDARTVRVSIDRSTNWRAVVELRSGGAEQGRQELSSKTGTCEEIASAVMFAVSVAIDPAVALAAPTPPKPASSDASAGSPRSEATRSETAAPPPPIPASIASSPSVAAPNAAERWRALAAVSAFGSFGEVPAASWGGAIEVGVESSLASLALEARAVAPAEAASNAPGDVRGWLAVATLVPCLHVKFAFACPLLSIGAFFGQGEGVTHTQSEATPYASAGGRLGIDVEVAPGLHLRVFGDVTTPLTPTTLSIAGVQAWRTPDVAGLAGASVVHSFL